MAQEPIKRDLGFEVHVTVELIPGGPEPEDYESIIEDVLNRRSEVVECEATLESNEEA
jgi:hypothetical protein